MNCMKTYSLTFQVMLTVALTNLVPLSDCIVTSFLFLNKDFRTAVIEVTVFSLIGMLQTKRENMSITFKRYLYLSLYFKRGIQSARPIMNICYRIWISREPLTYRFVQSVLNLRPLFFISFVNFTSLYQLCY